MLGTLCMSPSPSRLSVSMSTFPSGLLDTSAGVCNARRYDGTVAFRSGERINFSYLISEKQNNDTVRGRCGSGF